ncbi:MAG: hypothetical protein K2X87_29405 [Gemmataceae bacterium]|nr:hypothetical protein [Gemmataceae bacterium]
MREYLMPCEGDDWELSYGQWPEVLRPSSLPFERLPGPAYRIAVAGVPIYFADEMPGIQMVIEGDLVGETARLVADEVLANLERLTGQRGRLVEL